MRKWLLFLALTLCIVSIINVDTVQSILPIEYELYSPPVLKKDFEIVVNPTSQGLMRQSRRVRENMLAYYPSSTSQAVRKIDRTNVFRARSSILDSLSQKYVFRSTSLNCKGHEYFNKDLETLASLSYLACMREYSFRNAQVTSPQGVPLRSTALKENARFQDIGTVSCNTQLREISRKAINSLLQAEKLAVQATILSSGCDKSIVNSAIESLRLAESSDLDHAVNFYRSAWRKAVSCSC